MQFSHTPAGLTAKKESTSTRSILASVILIKLSKLEYEQRKACDKHNVTVTQAIAEAHGESEKILCLTPSVLGEVG